VHRHSLDRGRVNGTVFQLFLGCFGAHDWQFLHFIENVPAIEEATKNGVQIVQVRLWFVEKEELRPVGIGAFIGHAQHSTLVVHIVGMKFVGKRNGSPNGFSTLDARLVFRRPALDHESLNVAMKLGAIVGARSAQCQKVKGRPRTRVAEYFHLQVANGGVQCDAHSSSSSSSSRIAG